MISAVPWWSWLLLGLGLWLVVAGLVGSVVGRAIAGRPRKRGTP